jgi:hypothetical protein
MLSPVRSDNDGGWFYGSGMTQIGFTVHAHFYERYSYDITRPGATGSGIKPDMPDNDNNSFYGYGKEVHAMVDGVVLGCDYAQVRECRYDGPTLPKQRRTMSFWATT